MRADERFNPPITGRWPRKRIIWSCSAARGPLLTRYYLAETPWFAIYLHHLHTSDEERALHDHPWSFFTFLLTGGYFEHTDLPKPRRCYCGNLKPKPPCPVHSGYTTVKTWHHRFSLLWRPAEWSHRLELTQPVWTLVLHLRRRREWGFFTPRGWQQWQAYGKEWCD